MPKTVQVIEQTSKKWKVLQLIGIIGVLVGVFCAVYGTITEASLFIVISTLSFVFGGIILIVGRLGAWWYHR